MSYDPESYEERQARNDKSRMFAFRDKDAWTDDDEMYVLENWIMVHPKLRDEAAVAQEMERTIEAVRIRAHIIREKLGINATYGTYKTTTTTHTVCWEDPDDEYPESLGYVRG